MEKTIDLAKSVYELTEEYPELIDIMVQLGFSEISKKPMRLSVGKIMTIPKGSKMKGIPLEDIVRAFAEHGFEVEGYDVGVLASDAAQETTSKAPEPSVNRTEQLKGYLRRLSDGEDLEAVRAEFAQEFAQVDASEIMNAEQEMLADGTPLEEVQRLCDVHSALFHGSTAEEMLARAEAAVAGALDGQGTTAPAQAAPAGSHAAIHAQAAAGEEGAAALIAIPGHPLSTFTKENEALSKLLADIKAPLAAGADVVNQLKEIRGIAIHYAKKGDLLFPLLKVNYGITGPSEVMWTVDDEIRDELGVLVGEADRGAEWAERVGSVLQRAEEMVFKEQNILFPLCAQNFTNQEWYDIYRDAKDYAVCLGVHPETWNQGEEALAAAALTSSASTAVHEGEVVMSGGHMSVEQLAAMLNTIPLEITFVDADNINRFFNEGPKVFKRPGMAIDRDVFSCHPPKIESMVRGIIDSFRAGESDSMPIWMNKGGRDMLVTYMAVRDASGTYLGTMEIVQDMEFAREHYAAE